ncbi:DUF551 domain-containing protein [Escherichia coli]|uniref:DUF551 domain-containing protein n=2 Tax=Escherichia coli TaxID=562 RepID=UPI001ABBEDAF|nr:DUF551 domain-containing protein [Escherichia coli]
MTTITKERLLTIKQWRETYGPGSNVVLPAEEAEELARIALAALEVEPIGFRCRRNDNLGDWSYVYHREPDDFERKHLVIEGIYAAPPAPVVPEEKPMPNPLSMYAVDAVAAIAEVRGWNACRAAMLHGAEPVSQTYKLNELSGNSPVTPDGWISCSERMPDDGQEVVVQTHSGWRYIAFYESHSGLFYDSPEGDVEYVLVTHWMPLPEPPQEVK